MGIKNILLLMAFYSLTASLGTDPGDCQKLQECVNAQLNILDEGKSTQFSGFCPQWTAASECVWHSIVACLQTKNYMVLQQGLSNFSLLGEDRQWLADNCSVEEVPEDPSCSDLWTCHFAKNIGGIEKCEAYDASFQCMEKSMEKCNALGGFPDDFKKLMYVNLQSLEMQRIELGCTEMGTDHRECQKLKQCLPELQNALDQGKSTQYKDTCPQLTAASACVWHSIVACVKTKNFMVLQPAVGIISSIKEDDWLTDKCSVEEFPEDPSCGDLWTCHFAKDIEEVGKCEAYNASIQCVEKSREKCLAMSGFSKDFTDITYITQQILKEKRDALVCTEQKDGVPTNQFSSLIVALGLLASWHMPIRA